MTEVQLKNWANKLFKMPEKINEKMALKSKDEKFSKTSSNLEEFSCQAVENTLMPTVGREFLKKLGIYNGLG